MATDLSTSLLLVRAMLWIAVLSLLVASAVTDIRDRIIPNRHVVWVASAGLALALLTRPGMAWASLLVTCAVFLGLGTLVHYNFLGGGDGKLLTAVVLIAPLDRIGPLLMAIALAGGLLSAAYLATYCSGPRACRSPQPQSLTAARPD